MLLSDLEIFLHHSQCEVSLVSVHSPEAQECLPLARGSGNSTLFGFSSFYFPPFLPLGLKLNPEW